MIRQLAENIRINFKFYRRNRLLQLIALFLVLIFCVTLFPSFICSGFTKKFYIITRIQSLLSSFILVMTAALALLMLYYHASTRCIKMVLTKPCLPEVWLLAAFLSGIILCFVLYTVSFLIALVLFLIWGIPFQWGLIFVALNNFATTVIIYSYLTMLTSIMHPALAALVALVIQEGTFHNLLVLLMGAVQGVTDPIKWFILKTLEQICAFFHIILPNYSPFSDRTSDIYKSYRVTGMGWLYLLYILGYTLLFAAFCYFVTVFFFKRRRYN